MNRINELLSTNMKKARKTLGMSQLKLAEACGVSTSFIGEIEIGRKFPSATTLDKIVDALKLKPHELFYEEGEPPPEKHKLYSDLYRELTETIDKDLRETLGKHLS